MATPPSSPPSPPPPPPTDATSQSPSSLKRTRKATRLRSLATRPVRVKRPLAHVDPVTGKVDGPHKKKLRTYLGIVARDKVEVILPFQHLKGAPQHLCCLMPEQQLPLQASSILYRQNALNL